MIDQQSIITLWNPKTESIFGWTKEEVIGKHLADTIIPPRYRAAHNNGMSRYLSTGHGVVINQTTELTAVNKQKEEITISITISELVQNRERSFIAFIRDVTQEHQTRVELRNKTILLEEKNRQLNYRNEELESFNYVASHDLQEPLRKIQTYAGRIFEEEIELSPKVRGYVDKVISSAGRMQNLIKDLLLFSHSTAAHEVDKEVELLHVLNEAKSTLAYLIEENDAQVFHTNLPAIRAIPFQMIQVFTNILGNAIKYRKPDISPKVWIGTQMVKAEEAVIPATSHLHFLKITITDNGMGFDPAFSNRIFDLFARLHTTDHSSGSGIGLAICKKIIQNHQGFINAESDGSSGSSFHIYLPEERVVK